MAETNKSQKVDLDYRRQHFANEKYGTKKDVEKVYYMDVELNRKYLAKLKSKIENAYDQASDSWNTSMLRIIGNEVEKAEISSVLKLAIEIVKDSNEKFKNLTIELFEDDSNEAPSSFVVRSSS